MESGILMDFIPLIIPHTCLFVGGYERLEDALVKKEKLAQMTGKQIVTIFKDNCYLVLITGFLSRESAEIYASKMTESESSK